MITTRTDTSPNATASTNDSTKGSRLTVASVNVNGIRAAVKHRSEDNQGFHQWLTGPGAECDIVLMQEVRASQEQAEEALAPCLEDGWHCEFAPAKAKGRAGVGILSRYPLTDVHVGIDGFEDAGRWIEATVEPQEGDPIRVASLYLPSGGSGAKQDEKYAFLDALAPVMADRAAAYPNMVVAGDWNICHRREDLKNWKTNRKKAGFLPDERAFMDSIFGAGEESGVSQINDVIEAPRGEVRADGTRVGNAGAIGDFFASESYQPQAASVRQPAKKPQWVDVQRSFHLEEEGPYSWYTWRGQAFDTGAGWRIDLHAATQTLAKRAVSAHTHKADHYDLRWSDHSPVVVSFAL